MKTASVITATLLNAETGSERAGGVTAGTARRYSVPDLGCHYAIRLATISHRVALAVAVL